MYTKMFITGLLIIAKNQDTTYIQQIFTAILSDDVNIVQYGTAVQIFSLVGARLRKGFIK